MTEVNGTRSQIFWYWVAQQVHWGLSPTLSLIMLSLLTVQATRAGVLNQVLVLVWVDVEVRLMCVVAISFSKERRIGGVHRLMHISLRCPPCLKTIVAIRFSKECRVLSVQCLVLVALNMPMKLEPIIGIGLTQIGGVACVQGFLKWAVDFSVDVVSIVAIRFSQEGGMVSIVGKYFCLRRNGV